MKILYFAWLREKIGAAQETVSLPPGVRTVADLVAWLRARGPLYEAAFAQTPNIRCAVDQEFAGMDTQIEGATEVAFFPPVTGG